MHPRAHERQLQDLANLIIHRLRGSDDLRSVEEVMASNDVLRAEKAPHSAWPAVQSATVCKLDSKVQVE